MMLRKEEVEEGYRTVDGMTMVEVRSRTVKRKKKNPLAVVALKEEGYSQQTDVQEN